MESLFIRCFDIFFSLFLLIILFPIILILIIISSTFIGFPPFYINSRVGKWGIKYKHFKIRSMKKGISYGREYFEQKRLSSYGRFIRKLHLDELPELLLILTGKMSFVGPRPLESRHLEKFDTQKREEVRPGWTGLAQIKLARKGILMGPEQIRFDTIYIKKRTFLYNMRIISATVYIIFSK